jgi:hypothetical protein
MGRVGRKEPSLRNGDATGDGTYVHIDLMGIALQSDEGSDAGKGLNATLQFGVRDAGTVSRKDNKKVGEMTLELLAPLFVHDGANVGTWARRRSTRPCARCGSTGCRSVSPQPKLINKAPKHKRKAAGSRGRIGVRLGR